MNQKTTAWMLVVATTVVGGFCTGVGTYLSDAAQHGFAGATGWKAFAVGALGAGMIGVSSAWHRFAPSPSDPSMNRKDGGQ